MPNILERMRKLGIKQVDMIRELRKRGLVVQPPEMSATLHGVNTYPKSRCILEKCDEILRERESV